MQQLFIIIKKDYKKMKIELHPTENIKKNNGYNKAILDVGVRKKENSLFPYRALRVNIS